jgi:phage baseplate assembly protein W
MAIRIENKNPLDINKRVAIGVSIPFNSDVAFKSVYTTSEQVKYNIINFILTNHNERVFNPNYGSNLRAFLFSGITEDNLKGLETKLNNDIKSNFPTVNINSLTLVPSYDENSIQLNIDFSVYNNNPQSIQIIL